jgi:HSP20 family protein
MVIDFSFSPFPRQIDRLFEELTRPFVINQRRMLYPPLNISEDADNITVRAEIPGLAMDELELTLSNKSLVLKGERKVEQGKYFRQERPTGAFQRIVNLNVPVDREKVKATLVSGVLSVVLPKSEDVKPKKIAIDVAKG